MEKWSGYAIKPLKTEAKMVDSDPRLISSKSEKFICLDGLLRVMRAVGEPASDLTQGIA